MSLADTFNSLGRSLLGAVDTAAQGAAQLLAQKAVGAAPAVTTQVQPVTPAAPVQPAAPAAPATTVPRDIFGGKGQLYAVAGLAVVLLGFFVLILRKK